MNKASLMIWSRIMYIVIATLLTGFISCASRNAKEELAVSRAQGDQYHAKFREWLRDTIISLNADERYRARNPIFEISSDSLQLDLFTTYQFLNEKRQIQLDKTEQYILDLLKEYSELPVIGSTVNFVVHDCFFPSAVEKFQRDFVEEVQQINVQSRDTVIEYGYIRGRLSDKIVSRHGRPISREEFIWNDGKLIKEKIGK